MSAEPPIDPAITKPTRTYRRDPRALGPDGALHFGTVCVAAIVGVDGKLRDLKVVRAAADTVLKEAVIQALKQWRYTPATLDGKAVEVPCRVFIDVHR